MVSGVRSRNVRCWYQQHPSLSTFLPLLEVTETHSRITTKPSFQASSKGQSKSLLGSWPDATYKLMLTQSKHRGLLQSGTACDLLDSHPTPFITIPVSWSCWVNACETFVPQARFHTTGFCAERPAMGTCKISPTNSVEPIPLIQLPSDCGIGYNVASL